MARRASDGGLRIADISRQLTEIRRELANGNTLDKPEQLQEVLQRARRRHSDGAVNSSAVEAHLALLEEGPLCPERASIPTRLADSAKDEVQALGLVSEEEEEEAPLALPDGEVLALPDVDRGPAAQQPLPRRRIRQGLEAKFNEMDAELRGGSAAEDTGALLQGLGPLCSLPSRAGPCLARTGLGASSTPQGLGPGARCSWGLAGRANQGYVPPPPATGTSSSSTAGPPSAEPPPMTAPPLYPAAATSTVSPGDFPSTPAGWLQELLTALRHATSAGDGQQPQGVGDEVLARQLQIEADEEAARALLSSPEVAGQGAGRAVPQAPASAPGSPNAAAASPWAPTAAAFSALGGGANAAAILARAGVRPQGGLPPSAWRPNAPQASASLPSSPQQRAARSRQRDGADAVLAARLQIEADEEAARLVFMAERAARNSDDDSSLFSDLQDDSLQNRRTGARSGPARTAQGMPPRPAAPRDIPGRGLNSPGAGAAVRRRRVPLRSGPAEPTNSDEEEREVVLRSAEERTTHFAAPGARAAAVRTATTTVVQQGETSEACTICCETFQDGETLRLLPCFHRYHAQCVDRWLAQSRTCPVCKHDITT